VNAFVSCSHEDERAPKKWQIHLAQLRREGENDAWTDHEILPGSGLDARVNEALRRSRIVVLLASPHSLASGCCIDRETVPALESRRSGISGEIPIVLDRCCWKSAPFGRFKALPKDGRAVLAWNDRSKAFSDIATGPRQALNDSESSRDFEENEDAAVGKAPARTEGCRCHVDANFEEIDRSRFRDAAFSTIRGRLGDSIENVSKMGNVKGHFSPLSDMSSTCQVIGKTG